MTRVRSNCYAPGVNRLIEPILRQETSRPILDAWLRSNHVPDPVDRLRRFFTEFGPTGASLTVDTKGAGRSRVEALRHVASAFPVGLIHASNDHKVPLKLRRSFGWHWWSRSTNGAYYMHGVKGLAVIVAHRRSHMIHELWHRFQHVRPELVMVERAFLEYREMEGRDLFDTYAHRRYPDPHASIAAEVIPVALQAIVAGDRRQPDAEHLVLTLAVPVALGWNARLDGGAPVRVSSTL